MYLHYAERCVRERSATVMCVMPVLQEQMEVNVTEELLATVVQDLTLPSIIAVSKELWTHLLSAVVS